MNDRTKEKIVELLREAPYNIFGNKLGNCYFDSCLELIADHLITNSVTVQEWISVDDRLPECCVSVLARCFYHGNWRTLACHTSKEHAEEWYTDEVCQWVKVTHWMPLPALPKGE